MLKQQARLVATFVFLADLCLVGAAFVAAHFARSELVPRFGLGSPAPALHPLVDYLPLLPLALGIWGVLLWSSGTYRSHRRVPLVREASEIARVSILAAGAFALAVWAFRLDERLFFADRISRSWIALYAVLSGLFLVTEKLTLRVVARLIRQKGLNYRTVILVGTGPTAGVVADSIVERRWWGYRLVGALSVPGERAFPDSRAAPVLGTIGDLDRIFAEQIVDDVIFAVPSRDIVCFEELVLGLQDRGVLVRYALDLLPHAHVHVTLEEIDGVPLVALATSPSGPFQMAVKRAMDLALSALLLVVAMPVIFGVAVAIKLTEGGAVLFRQRRCGMNGRTFTLYKFRTMVENAEARRLEVAHLNRMGGPVFKAPNDPRVTRLGRFLRRFSLDELPQLWNVLRGDMSLVGPRPPIPEEVARYQRWQRRRLAMKPGITCLWQVSGRNELDFDRWMALDLHYIDNWSPWLDLKILARTLPVVLSGRGAS